MHAILSLLCLPLLAAPSRNQQSAIADPKRPVFDTTEHDFGTVFSDRQYSHKFRFKSGKGVSVKVAKVEAGCKCSAGVVRSPAAGSSDWGEIEVKVKMGNRSDNVTQHVKVHMVVEAAQKGENSPIGQSALQGNAAEQATVRAEREPEGGSHGTTAAAAEERGRGVPGKVASQTRDLRPDRTGTGSRAPRRGVPKLELGNQTEDPKPLIVPLTLKAYVVQRGVFLKPARLMLGRIARDAAPSKAVRLEIVTALVPGEIKKVCCSVPWLQASLKEVEVDEKDRRLTIAHVCAYDLTLKLDAAKAKPGSFLEFVTVYTNSTRYPFADLPIKGRVEK